MPDIILDGGLISVLNTRPEDALRLQSIPGRQYDVAKPYWRLPLTRESLMALRGFFPDAPEDPRIMERISDVEQRVSFAAAIRDGAETGNHPAMPVKGSPYAHQVRAYEMGLTLLGDA